MTSAFHTAKPFMTHVNQYLRRQAARTVPLCNAYRLSSSVLSGALIKGSTVGLGSFSEMSAVLLVSQLAIFRRRLQQQTKGRRRQGQRLSASVWSCLIQSCLEDLPYLSLALRILPSGSFTNKVTSWHLIRNLYRTIKHFTLSLSCLIADICLHKKESS